MAVALTEHYCQLGERARAAAAVLQNSTGETRRQGLLSCAAHLRRHSTAILAANMLDVAAAKKKNLRQSLLDRLLLTAERLDAIIRSVESVAERPDPLHKVLASWQSDSGLKIERVSTPLGVIGIIYESRPNVTAEAAALAIKAGNACILRSGSDCFQSANAIIAAMKAGLASVDLPAESLQDLGSSERQAVDYMLAMDEYIDVIVPRGGKQLLAHVKQHSVIPVFGHLSGVCHTYIHSDANLEMARKILFNSKMRRTGICGATEALVIDRSLLPQLPAILDELISAGCEIRGDRLACESDSRIVAATADDWGCEFLDAILAVKVVNDYEQARDYISRFGSKHTDAIITENSIIAAQFLREIDSAIVIHNGSTQFADGGEFGMGAEIGISTNRLHARGPVGAEQLTCFKYRVYGGGLCRP